MELTHIWNFVKEENDRLGRGMVGEEVVAKVTKLQIGEGLTP